jgi:regulator of sirC expression with transglutaminase-like and TPR domain
MTDTALKDFADIVTGADENINLVEAALVIAGNEYPGLDTSACLLNLEMMADELQLRVLGCSDTADIIAAMNRYIFDELGFSGNLANFNDPRNSYFNDVLERRLGIPLTLSMLYMELGRRIGLPVMGISFPGHFLVKLEENGRELVLDPFTGGIVLDEEELRQRLTHFSKAGRRDWDLAQLLVPASNRAILARMLRNLKNIYFEAEDFDHALEIVNFLLVLLPGDPVEVRDRAYVHDKLNCFRAAIEDYQNYLMLQPETDDAFRIQTRLADLKLSARRLH